MSRSARAGQVTLTLIGVLNSGLTWPWIAHWVLPAFLFSHVALLGTVVPDAILAAIAIVALAASRPTRDVPAAPRGPRIREAA